MRKAIFILVITLILAVTVMPASASRYGRGPDAVHGYGKDIMAIPDLNLTVEQKSQITSLRETFLKDIKPLRDKLFSKRGDLKLLWRDKNPNQAKILATQKQIRTLRGQIQDRATVQRLAVRKVLTSDSRIRSRPSSILLTDLSGKNSVLLNISTSHQSRRKR